MKTYNHLFETVENFSDFLDGIVLDRNRQVLLRIRIFCAPEDRRPVEQRL